jgi:hypothetical protein
MELLDVNTLILLVEGLIQLGLATTLLLCSSKLKKLLVTEYTSAYRAISSGFSWLAISIIVPFVLGIISPLVLEDSIDEYYFAFFDLPYLIMSLIAVVAFGSAYRKFKNIAIAT